jgi:hypothetical protein
MAVANNPNIGNCDCISATGVPIPCPTTVLGAYAYPASTGTITLLPYAQQTVNCAPIMLPRPTYTSCSGVGVVHVIGLKVAVLQQHGMLKLRGVVVTLGQVIAKEDMGLLVYSKTPLYVGTDTIEFQLVTNVGTSANVVMTINNTNVDCTGLPTCPTC